MIGEVIAAALPMLRAQAESLMADTCDIERLAAAWDEAAQKTTTTWAPVHMAARCHFEEPAAPARVLLTDEAVTPATPTVKVPVSLTGILPDDRVTVAGVGVLWVTHVPLDTHAVERILECRWVK